MDTIASTGADMLIHHGIPFLSKKAVEMGRYYSSEALRNPKLQEKAIDYALDKLNPMIHNVGNQALDQLSTKIRPNKKYKTDRKDLDGRGIIDKALTRGYSKSYNTFVKEMGWGAGLDIHKAILKVAPKKGFVMPGHHYTGPGNPLEQQLKYNPDTGQILEIYQQPTGKTDAIAMQHDVDYSVCKDDKKCKNKADRKMVKSLDAIPYKDRQWGHWLARNTIDTKQKLGLGKPKNVTRRRVKKIGKKN